MPKRIIDGDALWTSTKLEKVSLKNRGEYAWILPLAQVNGCFECTPKLVWRTCYSGVREDWTVADVTAMLDEFEAVKMLFRFKVAENTYGFFPGTQKDGRLPSQSERNKYREPWKSGMVPVKELASFLGLSVRETSEMYRGLLFEASKKSRRESLVGNGNGNGNESGEGNGNGLGHRNGNGNGTQDSATPTTHITMDDITFFTTNNTNTQHTSPAPNTSPVPAKDPRTVSEFLETFRLALRSNPHASAPPSEWEKMWKEDFNTLLALVPKPSELYDILVVSQLEKNQKYYVRPQRIIANLGMLLEMVKERLKAMPALRVEFRKKLASPISAEEERDELEDDDDDLA
jgi:hypothetical protein